MKITKMQLQEMIKQEFYSALKENKFKLKSAKLRASDSLNFTLPGTRSTINVKAADQPDLWTDVVEEVTISTESWSGNYKPAKGKLTLTKPHHGETPGEIVLPAPALSQIQDLMQGNMAAI